MDIRELTEEVINNLNARSRLRGNCKIMEVTGDDLDDQIDTDLPCMVLLGKPEGVTWLVSEFSDINDMPTVSEFTSGTRCRLCFRPIERKFKYNPNYEEDLVNSIVDVLIDAEDAMDWVLRQHADNYDLYYYILNEDEMLTIHGDEVTLTFYGAVVCVAKNEVAHQPRLPAQQVESSISSPAKESTISMLKVKENVRVKLNESNIGAFTLEDGQYYFFARSNHPGTGTRYCLSLSELEEVLKLGRQLQAEYDKDKEEFGELF